MASSETARAKRDPGGAARDAAVTAQYATAADATRYAESYGGRRPQARFFWSRLHVVDEALRAVRRGRLLDVGCGPGMLVRHLLDTRPGAFRITGCDLSPAMIDAAAARTAGSGDVEFSVACVEEMPFPDQYFDVVVAMGVLEYADAGDALREIARVVRPGGLVVVTMLNPLSPYRLVEWCVYWPLLRVLGRVEGLFGVPRHAADVSGIRAIRPARLRRMMRQSGLTPQDAVHFDVTPLVPPLDRPVRRWSRTWREHPERTVSRGARRCLGTAYLVRARRDDEA
ncbi:MAG: methyltransferase domain-containing protein [Streptomyces sp.]|uniref:class I SAM-dependent methyltransferase n=1 Tax=Streptomyces sp. TaxID=1931 RepID=UPI0025F4F446|nr:class I SAM-dependent methyltransferase [Streptomyces sp.]MBW8795388.1 methyltransferase domain-containing protein [Streptomyces sp.]